jgi:hypothetical protein
MTTITDFGITTSSIVSGQYNQGQLAGFRNKILNGRFNINQAGAASRTAAVGYNYDQWYYDGTYLYQPVPTEDVYDGTYTLSWEGDSTAAWSLNALGSSVQNAQSYTPAAKGGQIVVSGHTNEHLWVRFATDLANLDKVQLEPGDTATPYEDRFTSQELSLCQAFFEPGGFNEVRYQTGGSGCRFHYTFNTSKRSPPSIVFSNVGYVNGSALEPFGAPSINGADLGWVSSSTSATGVSANIAVSSRI